MSEPCYVPYQSINEVWNKALEILDPAFDHCDGKYQPEDVLARLQANTAILLLNAEDESFNSVMVAWPAAYPRCTILEVAFAAGDKKELKNMIPALQDMAHRLGCDRIEVHGRHGWVREFKDVAEHTSSTVRMWL